MPNAELGQSILILGMKRSGTNWVESTLVPLVPSAVNEPLGLHNDSDPSNPLNPWNYSSRAHISREFGHTQLQDNPYGALITKSFLDWLREGGKLIKETDFLYADWLLESAPLKIVVLERDPRGSIASYKKWGLYDKWGFDEKMEHFRSTVYEEPKLRELYEGLFDKSNKIPIHRKLAVYYAIGISEIARVTQDQAVIRKRYEDLLENPLANFEEIIRLLGLPWMPETERLIIEKTTRNWGQSPYGTYRAKKDLQDFKTYLTPAEERDIRAIFKSMGITLDRPETVHHEGYDVPKNTPQKLTEIDTSRGDLLDSRTGNAVELDDDLAVSKSLTSNEEYSAFLNWLLQNGVPLTHAGFPIFHNDKSENKIKIVDGRALVEEGGEDYPVSFINWIGASLFAAWAGGRLPTPNEWEKFLNDPPSNEEAYGPKRVNQGKPNEKGIYDASSNVAVWLRDDIKDSSYERSRAGKPWNHSTDFPIIPTSRPYWLGTTGLGIRVIYDGNETLEDEVLLHKIKAVINFLTKESHGNNTAANQELFQMINNLGRIEENG